VISAEGPAISRGKFRTWVCEGYFWSLVVSKISPDWWHSNKRYGSHSTDDERVEDGWLLNCCPSQIFDRLRPESWKGGHDG
jgi:hypothetical protein